MTLSAETARLTQAHLAAQLGVRASVIRDIVKLFPMWNPFEPGSLEAFAAAVTLLAQKRSLDSAALAARYFELFREIDLGLTAGKALALAEPPVVAQVQAVINSTAVASFWRGLGQGLATDQAKDMALRQLTGGIGRVAMAGGRQTLVEGIRYDDHYRGRFIRVTDGDPCGFCAMMASRGPIYLDDDSDGAAYKYHDRCGCSLMPYSGGAWPEENQKLQDLWNESTKGYSMHNEKPGGRGGNSDALRAFRNAVEGKPAPTYLLDNPTARTKSRSLANPKVTTPEVKKTAAELLREQQRAAAVDAWRKQQGK